MRKARRLLQKARIMAKKLIDRALDVMEFLELWM